MEAGQAHGGAEGVGDPVPELAVSTDERLKHFVDDALEGHQGKDLCVVYRRKRSAMGVGHHQQEGQAGIGQKVHELVDVAYRYEKLWRRHVRAGEQSQPIDHKRKADHAGAATKPARRAGGSLVFGLFGVAGVVVGKGHARFGLQMVA